MLDELNAMLYKAKIRFRTELNKKYYWRVQNKILELGVNVRVLFDLYFPTSTITGNFNILI